MQKPHYFVSMIDEEDKEKGLKTPIEASQRTAWIRFANEQMKGLYSEIPKHL